MPFWKIAANLPDNPESFLFVPEQVLIARKNLQRLSAIFGRLLHPKIRFGNFPDLSTISLLRGDCTEMRMIGLVRKVNWRKVLDVLGWVGFFYLIVYGFLKVFGVIHSPPILDAGALASVAFFAGGLAAKVDFMEKTLNEHGVELRRHSGEFRMIDRHLDRHDFELKRISSHLSSHDFELKRISRHLSRHDFELATVNSELQRLSKALPKS